MSIGDETKTDQFVVVRRSESDSLFEDDSLVLAWARDRLTGRPRYILELGIDRRGAKCDCDCMSCGLPLEAVNAGKSPDECHRRPHFRHPSGAKKEDCQVLTARALVLQQFHDNDVILLPRRQRTGRSVGLSGKEYAWVEEAKPEAARIKRFQFTDRAKAILTLDDGRELEVVLVGSDDASLHPESGKSARPVLVLVVDDPEIASLPLNDLKDRLRLIGENGRWCSHWRDAELDAQAEANADALAEDALDRFGFHYEFPADATEVDRRETLLHLLAKEILERERQMVLPDLVAEVGSERELLYLSQAVKFESVELEKPMGQIRPDVFAVVQDAPQFGVSRVLVEVTVTNGITPERAQRIANAGIPAIEINLSLMGGQVTKGEFASIVVGELAGKRWIFHPELGDAESRLKKLIAEESELRPEVVAQRFLGAMERFGNEARKLDGDQNEYAALKQEVRKFAGQLAALGYPEAIDDFFLWPGHLINRLQSIKANKAIGYRLDTAWQVINAIRQERGEHRRWQTIYLMAIKVWRPSLTGDQESSIGKWRKEVEDSLRVGEDTYRRPPIYDKLLGLLFPDLEDRLKKPLPINMGIPASQANHRTSAQEIDESPGLRNSQINGKPENVEERNRHVSQSSRFRPSPYEKSSLWLTGDDYEQWKKQHPENARIWEESMKAKAK